jgi:hypothetical protein
MDIVDDPPREVAYLRLNAHVTEKAQKPNLDDMQLRVRPTLEEEFQRIYDKVKGVKKIAQQNQKERQIEVDHEPATLKPIGEDVYATNTIIPPSGLTVEEALVYCFDALTGTLLGISSDKSSLQRPSSPLSACHINHSPLARHV